MYISIKTIQLECMTLSAITKCQLKENY